MPETTTPAGSALRQSCPTCGETLSADAPEGLCPSCLLRQAIADGEGNGPEPPSGPAPGTRLGYLGDYELLEEIGRGGMGVVYRARQQSLDRIVAVKILPGGMWAPEERIGRFHTEARAAARIQHPNIVAIHEVGEHEGQPFFSMDYVEGESLDAVVKRGPAKPAYAAELVRALATAVQVAHEQGILHRDIKPSNILLNAEGVPHVSDFGLAKILGAEVGPATLTGAALGTPGYMAPEQVRSRVGAGANGDGTTVDVYSLGAVLYALLSGHAPFAAENPLATMLEVLGSEPEPLRRKDASVPRDLETICLKCLDKDPGRRYASARELAEDLGRFLTGHPIAARPVGRAERFARWCRRRPGTLAALLVIIAAVALTRPWEPPQALVLQALLNEARAKRLAGDRDGALEAIAEAARKKDNEDVRVEAVKVVTTPGARRVRQFLWGIGFVRNVKVSGDRRYLAVSGLSNLPFSSLSSKNHSGSDFSAKVWDLSTGQPVARRWVDEDPGLVGFIPGKRSILINSDDGTYVVWDPVKNQTAAVCPNGWSRYVRISPDGRWIASTDDYDEAEPRICRLEDLEGEDVPFGADLVGSPDGRELFLLGPDRLGEGNRFQVWDLETGMVRPIPVDLPFFGITDDARFALFREQQKPTFLRIWDLQDHRWAASVPDTPADSDQWILSPDGKRLVLGSTEDPRGVRIWDLTALDSGARRWPIAANRRVWLKDSTGDAAFSPDSTLLAVTGEVNGWPVTWIWDLENTQEVAEIEGQGRPIWLSDDLLLTSGRCEAPIKVRDFEEYNGVEENHEDREYWFRQARDAWIGATSWRVHRPIVTLQASDSISRISFNADGTQMAVGATVWDFEIGGGPILRRSRELPKGETAVFDPLGRPWSVKTYELPRESADLSNPFMRLRRIDGEDDVVDLKHPRWPPGSLARTRRRAARLATGDFFVFDPDGATILLVLLDLRNGPTRIGRWELSSGRQVPLWRDKPAGGEMSLLPVSVPPLPEVSRDGTYLATGDGIFDTRNGERIWQPGDFSGFRYSSGLHFSPDGTRLFSGNASDVSVLDITERRESRHWFESRLEYTPSSGSSLSPDGKLVAVWSHEVGVVAEAESGKVLVRWRPHTSSVQTLAFHPGGRFLVSGSVLGELKIWDLEALRRDLSEVGLGW